MNLQEYSVFPGDAKIEKVDTGREGDRIYRFKFVGGQQEQIFFWMQEPKSDKDSELIKKLEDSIERPDGQGASGGVSQQDLLRQALGQNSSLAQQQPQHTQQSQAQQEQPDIPMGDEDEDAELRAAIEMSLREAGDSSTAANESQSTSDSQTQSTSAAGTTTTSTSNSSTSNTNNTSNDTDDADPTSG